jgi:hypothetical protein
MSGSYWTTHPSLHSLTSFQAIKVFDLTRYLFHASESTSFVGKWVVADALFILGLSQLRIPRLTYTRSSVALQLCLASILNGFIFGGLFVDVGLSPFSRIGSTGMYACS